MGRTRGPILAVWPATLILPRFAGAVPTALIVALLTVAGCPDTEPADVPLTEDRDVGDDDIVGAEIVASYPAEGATNVFYRDAIWVEFSDDPIKAGIDLRHAEGGRVPGTQTWSEDRRRLTFDPFGASELDQLQTTAAYTATVTYAGHADAELHFETSAACAPLGWNSDDPVGAHFHMDLGEPDILAPPAIGQILAQYLSGVDIVIHVVSLDDDAHTAELVLGLVEGYAGHYVQESCLATIQVTEGAPALWDDPYLAFGAADFVYDDGLFSTTVRDLSVSGCLTPQGDHIALGSIEGVVDMRDFDALIPPGAATDDVCELLDDLGIPCEPCPDGSGPFCHTVVAIGLTAERVSVTATDPETLEETDHLVPVTTDQVAQWEQDGVCLDVGSGCAACAVSTTRHRPPYALALTAWFAFALVWRRTRNR